MRGIIPIYKPVGITSSQVCLTLRNVLLKSSGKIMHGRNKAQPLKVGHGGTIDFEAEGVLVVGVGEDCKHLSAFLSGCKSYRAVGILGKATSTYEDTGDVTRTVPYAHITHQSLERVVNSFQGGILQTPPAYSAIKINGQRASDLARKGQSMDMTRKRRTVSIYEIRLERFSPPEFDISLSSSAGTYVRSLIHDIGLSCGSAACVKYLCRTKQGKFTVNEALTKDKWTFEYLENFLSY